MFGRIYNPRAPRAREERIPILERGSKSGYYGTIMFTSRFVLSVLFLSSLFCGCGERGVSSRPPETVQKSRENPQHRGGSDQDTGCPVFSKITPLGVIASPQLREISGVVVSRTDANVLWIHNDSGDSARLYAIGTDGSHLGTYTLVGADAVDWEDMAADGDYLYLGDIGDNFRTRKSVTVYRVKEPPVSKNQSYVEAELTDVVRLELVYPDGPTDAETLLVDPVTGDLFIVTKKQNSNTLYRAGVPHGWNGGQVVLERVEVALPFKKMRKFERYGGEVTGGDVSRSGDAIILRDYWHAYLWRRSPGSSIGEALGKKPCKVPVVSPMVDGQGEAIGFDAQGSGYYTIPEATEGVPQIIIYYFEKKKPGLPGDSL